LCGLVHQQFQLAHIDFDVVLAHPRKATNGQSLAFDFAGLVDAAVSLMLPSFSFLASL